MRNEPVVLERQSGRRALYERQAGRNAVAVLISVLTHLLLLLWLGEGVRPVRDPRPAPTVPQENVVYLQFPEPRSARGQTRSMGESLPQVRVREQFGEGSRLPRYYPSVAPEKEQSIGKQDAPVDAPAPTPPASGVHPLFQSGFRDARLYVEPRAGSPSKPPPAHERLVADAHAAVEAARDSLAAEKRDFVYHVSRGYYPSGKIIMPEDGPAWQLYELLQQKEAFTRDSTRQARIKAVRERKDAERKATRNP